MRKMGIAVAAMMFVAGFVGPVSAASQTVKGQLVDQECYLMEKKVDTDASCAVSCAKSGKPVALLTADGKLYEVTGALAANKNAKLADHMLKKVEITGEVSQQSGKLSIAADSIKVSK